ncbi:MAG: monophosphatase [Actinomycetota bacterium]|nr:monophosphatase [Actinomycetota bacterium]
MQQDDYLSLASEIAAEAGSLLLERFGGPARGISTKSSPTDLVSDADRDAERLLVSRIKEACPADGIVGEEGGAADSKSGVSWILDPLDGTVNFLFGIPAWAVSIGIGDNDGGFVGVVVCPPAGETYAAARGCGATLNGDAIRVSDRKDLSTALIGTGFSYEPDARSVQAEIVRRVVPRVRDIRRGGSAALDLCSVASGRLDGLYEAPMERWDKAAGLVIVTEAGGVWSEMPPPIEGMSPGVIASSVGIQEDLRDLVLGETWT